MRFQIAELPEEFLHRVRVNGIDDQGQPVKRHVSLEGGEPCRDALRRAHPGDDLITASYCPFPLPGPFKEYGPVTIFASPHEQAVKRNALPLKTGNPTDYFAEQFILRAYSNEQTILDARMVTSADAYDILDEFLSDLNVEYVQARFPFFGCFACRINRQ